jgi:hypothetical protein
LESPGTINTGNGNDTITGTGDYAGIDIDSFIDTVDPIIDTGKGDDIITGIGGYYGLLLSSFLNTGDGNDTIIGISTTGDAILNSDTINTGDGNDIITGTSTYGDAIFNSGTIDTGDGNDIIIGIGTKYPFTGNISNRGTINTGNGADSIIADNGFFASDGNIFLGNGTDYIRGSGSANLNGGNDQDSLELRSGTYTIKVSGTTVSFTRSTNSRSGTMITSEFEKLIAGSITYDFTNLIDGQTIVVA